MPTPVINRPEQNGSSPSVEICDGSPAATSGTAIMRLKEYPIKGGSLGPNGVFRFDFFATFPNSAGQKEFQFRLTGVGGSFTFYQVTLSANTLLRPLPTFRNLNNQSAQLAFVGSGSGIGAGTSVPARGTIDTAQDFKIEVWCAAFTAPEVTTMEHVLGVIYQG